MSTERGVSPNQEAPKPTTPDSSITRGLTDPQAEAAVDALTNIQIEPAQVTPESELDSMESHQERLLEGKRRKRVYDDAKDKYDTFLRDHKIEAFWMNTAMNTANKPDQDNPFIPELKERILELHTLAADAGLIKEFDRWDTELSDIAEYCPPAPRSIEQCRELDGKCVGNAIRFGLDNLVLYKFSKTGEPVKFGVSNLSEKFIEGEVKFVQLLPGSSNFEEKPLDRQEAIGREQVARAIEQAIKEDKLSDLTENGLLTVILELPKDNPFRKDFEKCIQETFYPVVQKLDQNREAIKSQIEERSDKLRSIIKEVEGEKDGSRSRPLGDTREARDRRFREADRLMSSYRQQITELKKSETEINQSLEDIAHLINRFGGISGLTALHLL